MSEDAHVPAVGSIVDPPSMSTIAEKIAKLRTSGGNCQLETIDVLLRRAGLRGAGNIVEDIRGLLAQRRTHVWRLAEVQKLMDEGIESADGRWLVRVSKPILNFILTGHLDGDADRDE